MPNYVSNRVRAFGRDGKDITKAVMKKLFPPDGVPDFQKAVPMPESLNLDCSSRIDECVSAWVSMVCPSVGWIGKREDKMTPMGWHGLMLKLKEGADCHFAIISLKCVPDSEGPGFRKKLEGSGVWKSAEEAAALGEKYALNVLLYGASQWYDWSIKNWGTKWPASNACACEGKGTGATFTTAWDPPVPVFEKASLTMPGTTFVLDFCDEDVPHNGEIVIRYGVADQSLPFGEFVDACQSGGEDGLCSDDFFGWLDEHHPYGKDV